jgi:deoxyribodipyrimidine photolyase-like uncharacterized protein
VKLATTPVEQRRWMEQWREAGIALDEVKRDELRNLSDLDAWLKTDRLLSLAPFYRRRTTTSGLVRQQSLFHRRSRK